jgi:hypothetical protein
MPCRDSRSHSAVLSSSRLIRPTDTRHSLRIVLGTGKSCRRSGAELLLDMVDPSSWVCGRGGVTRLSTSDLEAARPTFAGRATAAGRGGAERARGRVTHVEDHAGSVSVKRPAQTPPVQRRRIAGRDLQEASGETPCRSKGRTHPPRAARPRFAHPEVERGRPTSGTRVRARPKMPAHAIP